MHGTEATEALKQVLYGGTLAFLVLAGFIIIFSVMYIRRKTKHAIEKKEMELFYQQEILKTQLEIQEQTLKNISQEIHDNIGQALTLAKLNLNTMLPEAGESLREKINNSKSLVSKAIGDLRDLSRSLDTDYVKEMGLQRALEYELEIIQKSVPVKTILEVEGQIVRLDKQRELILFRIIQETFHNIIKHADAQIIRVQVNYDESQLEIMITDDGKGVDLSPVNDGNSKFGLGIRNMNNRARLIGAQFTMASNPGKGTEVKIVLPLENTNHAINQ